MLCMNTISNHFQSFQYPQFKCVNCCQIINNKMYLTPFFLQFLVNAIRTGTTHRDWLVLRIWYCHQKYQLSISHHAFRGCSVLVETRRNKTKWLTLPEAVQLRVLYFINQKLWYSAEMSIWKLFRHERWKFTTFATFDGCCISKWTTLVQFWAS